MLQSEAQFSSSDASRYIFFSLPLILFSCLFCLAIHRTTAYRKIVFRNELLQAMDLRIAALRRDLVAAFNEAVGPTCSYEEFTHLAEFSENFGATDLK